MIIIPADRLAAIRVHGEAAFPEECCGLLVGRREPGGDIRVEETVPAPNVALARDRCFEVDPRVRFRLIRALRGTERAIVGHYHSHPCRPAEPSDRDHRHAFEADMVWLIVAVAAGRAGPVTAWRPAPARPEDGPPELVPFTLREEA